MIAAIAIFDPNTNVIAQELSDTVWLEPSRTNSSRDSWYPGSIVKIEGQVQSFNHQAIRIIIDGEPSETAIAAYRVLWIQPGTFSEDEKELNSLLAEKQRRTSLQRLSAMIRDQDVQAWRKQMAYMKFSNLCFQIADYATAIQMTGEFGGPLPPLVLAWLPIAWTREHQATAEHERQSQDASENSLQSRLVYLSWKLPSIGRENAVAAIDKIIAEPSRPYLRQLARALRWRLATPQEVIENAETWEAEVDAMPMVLQVGPTLALIEKFQAAGLAQRAERLKLSLQLTPPFPHPSLLRD